MGQKCVKFYAHFYFSLVSCTMKSNIITDPIFQAYDIGQVDQLTKGVQLNTLLLEDIGGITAGDYNASVDLQELLIHTAKRIIEPVWLSEVSL